MAKYKKKPVIPVIVDAWHWQGNTLADATLFCEEMKLPKFHMGARNNMTGLIIPTLAGYMVAQRGDWIIKKVSGVYDTCKPDIFEQTYELVEEEKTKEYLIEADCPRCGEVAKFTKFEMVCPSCGLEGRINVEWEIIEDENDGS